MQFETTSLSKQNTDKYIYINYGILCLAKPKIQTSWKIFVLTFYVFSRRTSALHILPDMYTYVHVYF